MVTTNPARGPADAPRGALRCPAPPVNTGIVRYGLDPNARFYQYGDSYREVDPDSVMKYGEALVFDRLLGLQIASRAHEYLDLGFLSGGTACILSLPCGGRIDPGTGKLSLQLPVRSLMGALSTLDLSGISGTLSARLGNRPSASNRAPRFIDIHVHDIMPELPGLSHAKAPMIDNSREELLESVEYCRSMFGRHNQLRDSTNPRDPRQCLQ